jgi:uncharacterized protein (TIGR03435 family)
MSANMSKMFRSIATQISIGTCLFLTGPLARAQEPRRTGQSFDVVSIKPCDPKTPAPTGRESAAKPSPGRLLVNCQNLVGLIHSAYVTYAGGHYNVPGIGPSDPELSADLQWMNSDRFTVEAKADAVLPMSVLLGPMLQTILEDRFKLKIHRESREVPVQVLTVTKTGSKLTPFKPGVCIPHDRDDFPSPLQPGQHWCAAVSERSADNRYWVLTVEGLTLDEIATVVNQSREPVINRTGLVGRFGFRVENESSDDYLAALKDQLGLELRPGKASRDVLMIDHAERPSPN